ncbi:uncharacterized protein MELLADRAFT_67943 [Melampsora larici-populina 98AG31]|uniref:Uncharacterized protein n=1 Tax=Melampsora larici-populina (strain 98AG31 / pathotype 3-4-7) TaxID=747676 RepID=F4S505_MELLP|nr:uncharacterized protein MELLADRAFT_67943 [Melampsora larici-populina 98AG31]EGG00233.1 hypothetical protein MELLADRAFT_67943 [Melampsora larici-populina 98AG31]
MAVPPTKPGKTPSAKPTPSSYAVIDQWKRLPPLTLIKTRLDDYPFAANIHDSLPLVHLVTPTAGFDFYLTVLYGILPNNCLISPVTWCASLFLVKLEANKTSSSP